MQMRKLLTVQKHVVVPPLICSALLPAANSCMRALTCCTCLFSLLSLSAGVHAAASAEEPLSTEGLDDWILSNLDQPTLRRARVSALVAAAQPFGYQLSEVLMVIGTALSTSVK
jgi:cyanate lyase